MKPTRIGMIVPSSNTCLEPQTYRILGNRKDVTVHFTRIGVTRIALDSGSTNQFDHGTMIAAAELLKTADVDVIAWNGTAGSWLGPAADQEMVQGITDATSIPATTSTLAYLDAFRAFGINRVGLVSPYTADVNQAITQQFAGQEVEVVREHHLSLTVNESFARVDPEDLVKPSLEMASTTNQDPVDALIYLCTNLYGAPVVERVESATDVPVLDSVAVTLWKCLNLTGAAGLDPRWGKLLI